MTRIASVALADCGFALSPDLELERHRAISDILSENAFLLKAPGAKGPYRVSLALGADRLLMTVTCDSTGHEEEIPFALAPLRRLIQDYIIVCDNFYKTARAGEYHKLQAIDAGRRSIHDEGAETLAEALEHKVTLDKTTARRLFSLVYILHARTITN